MQITIKSFYAVEDMLLFHKQNAFSIIKDLLKEKIQAEQVDIFEDNGNIEIISEINNQLYFDFGNLFCENANLEVSVSLSKISCKDIDHLGISFDTTDYCKESDYNILFIIESTGNIPKVYNFFSSKHQNCFEKIYSWNQNILDTYQCSEYFSPNLNNMTCEDALIKKEKKYVSMLITNKTLLPGHKLRLKVYDLLDNYNTINGMKILKYKSPPFIKFKDNHHFYTEALYNIANENVVERNYFTEHLISCFISKTIPIYYGCPNLSDWFNMDGVIVYNDIDDIKNILDYINEDYYNSKREVIEENYELAKPFYTFFTQRISKKIITHL